MCYGLHTVTNNIKDLSSDILNITVKSRFLNEEENETRPKPNLISQGMKPNSVTDFL